MKKIVLSLVMVLVSFSLFAEDTRPNILFILTDDMGYSDVGFNQVENSPVNDIVTPNIDALANDGTIFSSAYAVHMFCGPSRAGLMTGRYPHKIGSQFNLAAFSDHGVTGDETFLSQVLHDAGYYTSIIGKWHLGETEEYHPNNRGYDHFYGFLGGGHKYFSSEWFDVATTESKFQTAAEGAFAEYSVSLMRNKEFLDNPSENLYLTDMLTSEGISVIDSAKAKDKPFFLFMSYNAPHTLLEAKDADIAALKTAPYNITFSDDNRATYSAMMYALDKQIKILIDALKAKGEYDNTLIVFMSDNGGKLLSNASANNHPLKGGKGDVDEGGIRVPMFMHWPEGMSGAPAEYDHVVSGLDLYPTFVNIANGTMPAGKELDGKDILSDVLANTDTRPDEAIFALRVQSPNNYVIARKGTWKAKSYGTGDWMLYDLDNDISERSKIAGEDSILTLLKDEAYAWAQTHATPVWYDNPDYGWEQTWADNNMPNWTRTFPEGDIVTEVDVAEGEVIVDAMAWAEGSPSNITVGETYKMDITYASDKDSAAYVVFYSKVDDAYGSVTDVVRVALPANPTLTTLTTDIVIPESLVVGAATRIHIGRAGIGSYTWANTERYVTTPVALYATAVEAGSGGSGDGIVLTMFTWEDGSKNGKDMPEGTTLNAKITYTGAVEGDMVYAIVTYKDGGTYSASAEQIEVTFTEGDGEVLVAIPCRDYNTSDAAANLARVTLGTTSSAGWGDRIDVAADGVSGNDVIYGVITGEGGGTGGGDESLSVTNFQWHDGSKDNIEISANATTSIKFSYENAATSDTLYLRIACKDNWGAFWATEIVTFTDISGEMTVDFTVRAYDAASADANRARAMLTTNPNGLWGDRFDVGADANAGNDAIYGNMVEGASSLDAHNRLDFVVYPNPSEGVFNFKLENSADITVRDLTGKTVMIQQGVVGLNSLHIEGFGSYILTIKNEELVGNTILQVM